MHCCRERSLGRPTCAAGRPVRTLDGAVVGRMRAGGHHGVGRLDTRDGGAAGGRAAGVARGGGAGEQRGGSDRRGSGKDRQRTRRVQ